MILPDDPHLLQSAPALLERVEAALQRLQCVTEADINAYILHLGQGPKPATISRRLTPVRARPGAAHGTAPLCRARHAQLRRPEIHSASPLHRRRAAPETGPSVADRRTAYHGRGRAAYQDHAALERHSFVTLALKGGASLTKMQEAARHADPKTTMRYAHNQNSLDDNDFDYVNW